MARYSYPAIFTPEEDGGYSVNFPNLDGCYTCGDDLADAIFMSEDVLSLILCDYENEKRIIPTPSTDSFSLNEGEFINYIACDTIAYRKKYNTKAVKKTLSIPEWLNEAAISMNINFSQVLQDALLQKIQSN